MTVIDKNMFPPEMVSRRQWITWKKVWNEERQKYDKIPYNAISGSKASSTNPKTWTTFDNAAAAVAVEGLGYAGVGFVFSKDDPFVGVDVDHSKNEETGEWSDAAKAILGRTPTYVEISQSGTGLHLVFAGDHPGSRRKNGDFEMYSDGRFFALTGNKMPEAPLTIAKDQETINWIYKKYIDTGKQEQKQKTKKKEAPKSILTDEEVLAKAKAAKDGDIFNALYEGRWEEPQKEKDGGGTEQRYATQSDADFALTLKLAFWCGKDQEQIDRLFRKSGLFREKWDERHYGDGSTYGQATIKNACDKTENVYTADGDSGIFVMRGAYYRMRGKSAAAVTNFLIEPVEMVISDEESQLTANFVTPDGFRQTLTYSSSDMASTAKFKAVLNKRTISLSFFGSDGDLEELKAYISQLRWPMKTGVKACGIYPYAGRNVFVCSDGAIEEGGKKVDGIVQLPKYEEIETDILLTDPIKPDGLKKLGDVILSYNNEQKTVSVLSWCAACFMKELFREQGIKFPHLFLIGEAGSGKSSTLEAVILPIFSKTKVIAATQVTSFTLMHASASSNTIPFALDEFKPSKIDRTRINALYNHFRDTYDGHQGVRGRADQTTVKYTLSAPLVTAGEEAADETAIRERSIELLFSKKELHVSKYQKAFSSVKASMDLLQNFGRSLLDMTLKTCSSEVKKWHEEGLKRIEQEFPTRVKNNLACCIAGLRLIEKLLTSMNLLWDDVFPLTLDQCILCLPYAAQEYLLDGGTANRSIVEESIEIMSRMKLDPKSQYSVSDDGGKLYLWLEGIYDDFTKYRKDHAIQGEVLSKAQFQKQLSHSDIYIDRRTWRIGETRHKCWVLDFQKLRERCDVSGFEDETGVEPLI